MKYSNTVEKRHLELVLEDEEVVMLAAVINKLSVNKYNSTISLFMNDLWRKIYDDYMDSVINKYDKDVEALKVIG